MEFQKNFIYETILHESCAFGNLDLFKYLVSLERFDIKQKDIFLLLFFMKFQQLMIFYKISIN